MGHSEMRLAVAGLDETALTDLNRRLVRGEWSAFRAAERVAFAFAHKQARHPAAVTPQDFHRLVDHFGRERAIDVVWWASRCHYMTRVADAFQLPLESANVFDGFPPAGGAVRKP
jgi:alkylhydroperoxidase family enzyme